MVKKIRMTDNADVSIRNSTKAMKTAYCIVILPA